MSNLMKIMLALSVFALAFAGIAVMDDSEESDAATARTWTVGTEVNQALMPGSAYSVSPGHIPGITFSIVYISDQLPEVIAADGTPTTPGTWTVIAYDSNNQVIDSMSITVNAASLTISTTTDGHGTATGGGTYNVGDTFTLTATPNSGYNFDKWVIGSTSVSTNPYSNTVTQAMANAYPNGMTVQATFTSTPQTYTHDLYYNANGGSGAPSTQSMTTSTATSYTFTISSTTPTRSGYNFLGWSTSSTATSASYQPGGTISVSANGYKTLYAVWQEIVQTYTVTFTVNNSTYGFVSPSSVNVNPGTTYDVQNNYFRFSSGGGVYAMANSAPSGYTYLFDHWSSESGTINSDMTITAYFVMKQLYTVSFVSSNPLVGTVSQSTISNVPDGSGITVYNDGSLSIYGTGVTVTATATDSNWYFDGWYIGSTQVQTGFTITADTTITAKFSSYGIQHGTAENPLNGISYSPFALWYETDKTYYVKGNSAVDLQKYTILNNTYSVTNVTSGVGLTISDGSLTGNITSDATVTIQQQNQQSTTTQTITLYAIYTEFTVTIQPLPYVGTVSPSTVQNVPYGTVMTASGNTLNINGTTVTATATEPNWYFDEWENVSGPITADRIVTAKFTTGGIDHGTRENPLNGITYSIGTLWYQEDKTYYVKAGTLVDMDKFIILNTTYSAINVTSGTGISVVDGELYGTITENATVTIQEQNQQSTSTQTINLVCVYLPLTVNVVSGGHGTVTGSGVYEVGETVTITGTPDQDYAFMRWTMQGGSTSANPWVFVVDRMVSGQTYNITGEFAKSVTDVTVTVSGEHGQVKVNDSVPSLQVSFRAYITGVLTQQGITVSGNTASFPYSTVQNVIAIPEAGYSAVWSIQNGAPVTDNMEVTLSFERTVYTISASSSSAAGGQVQIENFNQSTSAGPGTSETLTAYYGDTVQLTAIPSTGYHLDKWTKNGLMYVDSLVFTITVTSNETFEAVFEATVITVTFDPTGGTVSPTSKTVSYGQAYGQLPTPTRYGFEFLGWFTDAAVGDRIQADTIVQTDQSHTLYAHWMEQMPDVFWWNDYVNGSIDIAFDFTGLADSRLHVMYIPLYSYNSSTEIDLENDPHGLNQFDQTGYTLRISCGYNTDLTLAIYQNGILQGEIYTYKIGMWNQYALEINAQTGKIIFKGIHALMDRQIQPFTFMNYKVVMSVTAIDFSDRITGLAFEKVYHADTGTGAHPSFQVSSTMTYLNTYGFVLVDPSINIYEQFPNYDNLRLNFYSFVYYGDSMTVNGHTIQLSDFGLLDLWYVPRNTPIYNDQQQIIGYTTENAISDSSDPRAIEQKIELQNIFVTWNNLHSESESERTCYLTFVDGKLDIAMGTFDIGDLEVSFSGVWYFTTMLYEPYIGKEISYEMDWNSWFNMDANAFILVYIALSVVFFIIANRFYQPGFLDYIVVGGAGLISYILLGGF